MLNILYILKIAIKKCLNFKKKYNEDKKKEIFFCYVSEDKKKFLIKKILLMNLMLKMKIIVLKL